MSKYADKVSARRDRERQFSAALNIAMLVTDGPPPQTAPRPKTPPPEPRGILVDLGAMPANAADAFDMAADALDRAAAIAREMLTHTHRSVQSGEATSAALLAETTAPRLRASAKRLRGMPSAPRKRKADMP